MEERVVELERLLEKAVKCMKELSSHLKEEPSRTKEQSFSLRNHTLCKVEQSLHTVGHSSKTQLQVSAHIYLYSFHTAYHFDFTPCSLVSSRVDSLKR